MGTEPGGGLKVLVLKKIMRFRLHGTSFVCYMNFEFRPSNGIFIFVLAARLSVCGEIQYGIQPCEVVSGIYGPVASLYITLGCLHQDMSGAYLFQLQTIILKISSLILYVLCHTSFVTHVFHKFPNFYPHYTVSHAVRSTLQRKPAQPIRNKHCVQPRVRVICSREQRQLFVRTCTIYHIIPQNECLPFNGILPLRRESPHVILRTQLSSGL